MLFEWACQIYILNSIINQTRLNFLFAFAKMQNENQKHEGWKNDVTIFFNGLRLRILIC